MLAAAAAGFGAFIERILAGDISQKPALHLLVNEELSEPDVDALLQPGWDAPLIEVLLARFGTPAMRCRGAGWRCWPGSRGKARSRYASA